MRKRVAIAAVIISTAFSPIAAAARDIAKPRAKVLQQVLDCATLPDAERLTCYDRTVAALGKAEEAKDVVVADREQVRETRRSLFGFRLPSLRIFGGGGKDDDLDQIDTTITSVNRSYDGALAMTLADGARWVQADDRAIVGKIPPGTKVVIRRGAMGSYFATIPGRPGFKVDRRN